MRITIRLYKKQDLDLMILDRNPNFSLVIAISTIVNAYVKGENKMVMLPDSSPWMAYSNLPRMSQLHITFTEEKDGPEVIQFLKSVLPNMRNNMIKNLVRAYMVGANLSFYFKSGEEHITDMDFSNVQIVSITKRTERQVLKTIHDEKSEQKEEIISQKSDTKNIPGVTEPVILTDKKENIPILTKEKESIKPVEENIITPVKKETNIGVRETISVHKELNKEIDEEKVPEEVPVFSKENNPLKENDVYSETNNNIEDNVIKSPIETMNIIEDTQNMDADDDFDIFGSLDKMLENF